MRTRFCRLMSMLQRFYHDNDEEQYVFHEPISYIIEEFGFLDDIYTVTILRECITKGYTNDPEYLPSFVYNSLVSHVKKAKENAIKNDVYNEIISCPIVVYAIPMKNNDGFKFYWKSDYYPECNDQFREMFREIHAIYSAFGSELVLTQKTIGALFTLYNLEDDKKSREFIKNCFDRNGAYTDFEINSFYSWLCAHSLEEKKSDFITTLHNKFIDDIAWIADDVSGYCQVQMRGWETNDA